MLDVATTRRCTRMMGRELGPAVTWHPHSSREGVRIGRMGTHVVVEWRGIGRLVALPSGDDAEFTPAQGVGEDLLTKFRATSLLACQRYLQGKVSLHGSAVRLPFGAVVLVGDSGAGKSTTAMALVEQGAAFLADDIVPIDWHGEAAFVTPVDDTFWLTPKSSAWFGLGVRPDEADKRGFAPRARAQAPERLSAIVHLTFDESALDVSVEPLTGHDKFLELSRAQVCYSTLGDDDTLRNLRARADLSAAARVFRLRRPRTMDTLNGIARALADALQIPATGHEHEDDL